MEGQRQEVCVAGGKPKSAFRVVLDASLEVRSAIVYASFIVILVFLPVFFLGGLAGSFFRPLGLAYILAILASLIVALTITPALCLILLPQASENRSDGPLVRALKNLYRRLLPPIIERPRATIAVVVLTFAGSGVLLTRLGEEFLPSFQETDFLMHWVEKPGTSIDAMRRITIAASRELRSIPGVRNFGAHIGRAEVADEVVGPNFTELWISIEPDVPYRPTVQKIQEVVDGYPGLYRDVLTYLKERIKEVLTGTSASIVVRIYGDDLAELRAQARRVGEVMADVDGVTTLKVEPQVLIPQIQVSLRPEVIANFGLTAADVRGAAATLVQGAKVGELFEDQKVFDVVVWGEEYLRNDPTALRRLLIDTPGGGQVPMADVADVHIVPSPNGIKRESASRRIDVTCNVREGADLGKVAREIEKRVRELPFARGYHPEFLGEYAARTESRNRLFAFAALALVGIFLLLQADFRSFRLATLVFLTLPFALIGGVVGAYLGGGVLSLGSLVGFVTVLGIAARNGIMLVSHYRHLASEGEQFGPGMILRGAEERLSPILMTAMCAGLGLLPLVIAGNQTGHEMEYPLAVVILGGLASSTVLNLLVVPSLILRFGKKALHAIEAE